LMVGMSPSTPKGKPSKRTHKRTGPTDANGAPTRVAARRGIPRKHRK